MDKLLIFLLSVVALTVPGVHTTHFRGAIISWRPGSAKDEIIIDYRISWRRSSNGHYCDSSTIQNGETVLGEGSLSCFNNCQGSLGSLHYQCTDYSLTEDWTSGKGRLIKTLTLRLQNSTHFEFGYDSGNWISSLITGGDGDWQLRVKGDLAARNDTGTINSSPSAEITPIVRLQYGCHHTIKIPVSDPDQDIVKCRWASSYQNECGDVCNGFPNAYLNNTACTLTYDASYSTGWYAVAIQVEDYANVNASQPLSSIPVQFLVQVYQSSDSCSVKPEIIDPSPIDGACIVVPVNETFESTITAQIRGSNRSIAEIKTTSPLGMVKSPLMQINSTTWQVNVTWAPTAINDTSNVFCYTATDTFGQQSVRRCITLLSGVSKPMFIDGYGFPSPTGIVSPDQRHWTVAVDSPFVRGSQHSYIRLYSERGSLLETIDASDSRRVTLNSYNQSLEFTTSTSLHENQSYYFLFDSEAVPIRLVNGPNKYSGRVEVFHGGAWGTVCDDYFDRNDAEVICRMLGLSTNDSKIEAFQQAHFGQGSGRIVLDDLECYGYESSLEHCHSSGWMIENCGHQEDAGVSCHATIRLVDGSSNYSGRVEVYHDGEWGTVCDDSFGLNDAKFICRQLGMYYGDRYSIIFIVIMRIIEISQRDNILI
ncbi:uncharacterized protein LOC128551720 isoform X2 [Mercenaria mercenaria]|uniref:uncharacterized protein LOC128551720 isoform X2 n=1 Tax=Mercenaria mercenaria TaxID=6596 RepID=UPI00234EB8ED|nr:uncharacterized protein LOC128551720 isoform X2 [Mercenaria mercenaria]